MSLAIIAAACALALPAARACKPLLPADRIREFIDTAQPSSAVVFTGKVISVDEQRQADGAMVAKTTLQPATWWMHAHRGAMVVRTVVPAGSPCPDIGVLHTVVGERWLIVGWLHDAVGGPWVEPGGGMLLKDGRLPRDVAQALRRMQAGG